MMQGYNVGRYDIVFATNVLHATANMSRSLRRCKSLLRKGGLLIANELSAKTDFLTLTFGLTDGWWLFEDAEWRIPGDGIIIYIICILYVCYIHIIRYMCIVDYRQ